MKFNVQSKTLHQQLQVLSKVINTKNALSILENFLFEVRDSRLYITGSDQENIMTASVDIMDVEGEGKVAINAKRLLDLLKELPPQGLTFSVNDQTLEVELFFQSGHFNFMGVDARDYPLAANDEEERRELTVPGEVIQKGIEATIFAVSTDTLRPMMMGIYWDIHPQDITFVSSDTHKLVRYINRQVAPEMEGSFIMPAKPASILRGIISAEEPEVKITIGKKNATFEVANFQLTCRFINGNYPNYNRVIPSDNPYMLTVDRLSLFNAMRRVALFASMASGLVKLDITAENIHLSAQDVDYSVSAEENVMCQYDGADMTIGFKAPFMVEVLGNLKSDEVVLKLSDPTRPGILTPMQQKEDEDILMLLMPMQTFDY